MAKVTQLKQPEQEVEMISIPRKDFEIMWRQAKMHQLNCAKLSATAQIAQLERELAELTKNWTQD